MRLEPAIVEGRVRHHRHRPKPHLFDYKMSFSLLDLDDLAGQFKRSRWWSLERWNVVSYRRRDYHHQHEHPDLKSAVLDSIQRETGDQFEGQVFMLTHLRYMGFVFNSVTFYFCVDDDGLQHIVAEITNTPWGEQHQYILPTRQAVRRSEDFHSFEFDKVFHISPFIEMNMHYRWGFHVSSKSVRVHMVNTDDKGDKIFDATYEGTFHPLTASNMRRLAWSTPWQPLKMVLGIYWQAAKLLSLIHI